MSVNEKDALKNGFQGLAPLVTLHQPLSVLYAQFTQEEITIQKEFGDAIPFEPLSPTNKALVERYLQSPRVTLPFYGSNSSGKSTLINALLGIRLMQTGIGHVTGRACMLEYADLNDSRIEFHSLDTVQFGTPESIVHCHEWTINDLADNLNKEISRDKAPQDQEGFDKWASTILKVFYPFPLLQTGVVLTDLPGRSSVDSKVVQKHIKRFLRTLNPPGVILVYSNPTFSDAEISAYQFLLEALPSKDPENRPAIFLCSSCFDIQSAMLDADLYELDDNFLVERISERYKLACNAPLPFIKLPTSVYDCKNFGCTNALEYLMTTSSDPLYDAVQMVFDQFLRKLNDWTVGLQQQRVVTAAQKIVLACQQIFLFLRDIRSGRGTEIAKEVKDAFIQIEILRDETRRAIQPIIHKLPFAIDSKSKDPHFIESALDFGSSISLGQYDNAMGDKGFEREATGALQSQLSPFLRQHFWYPLLEEVREDIVNAINKSIARFSSHSDSNLTMRLALQATATSTSSFSFEPPTSTLNPGLSRTLSKAIKFLVHDLRSKSNSPVVIDPEWKRSTTRCILSSLQGKLLDLQLVENGIMVFFQAFTQDLSNEVLRLGRQASSIDMCQSVLRSKPNLEHHISQSFYAVGIPIISIIQAAKGTPRYIPDFDTHNLYCRSKLYEVFFSDDHFYKVCHSTSINEFYYEFCLGAQLNYLPPPSYVVPPSHIWTLSNSLASSSEYQILLKDTANLTPEPQQSHPLPPSPFGHTQTYVLVFDKCKFSGLKNYQSDSVSATQCLFIGIALASVLDHMHQNGVCFGSSLSIYSIWIPKDNNCPDAQYLSSIRVSALGQPHNAPSPYPEEEDPCSEADMYAFGSIMRELHSNCNNMDHFPIMQLIAPCFNSPQSRPSSSSILLSLVHLLEHKG